MAYIQSELARGFCFSLFKNRCLKAYPAWIICSRYFQPLFNLCHFSFESEEHLVLVQIQNCNAELNSNSDGRFGTKKNSLHFTLLRTLFSNASTHIALLLYSLFDSSKLNSLLFLTPSRHIFRHLSLPFFPKSSFSLPSGVSSWASITKVKGSVSYHTSLLVFFSLDSYLTDLSNFLLHNC